MKTENLQEVLWAYVWVPAYKPHFVPKRLAAALVADLQERCRQDHPEHVSEDVILEARDEGGIDLPGMIMMDRPIEHIKIDTFKLAMPSQDFTEFLRELALAPKRMFAGGQEYYKIHGWRVCMVFTPEQRELMLKAMEEMLDDVEKRAEAADKEFSRRLREINKDGVRVISHRDKESPHVKRVAAPKKENN